MEAEADATLATRRTSARRWSTRSGRRSPRRCLPLDAWLSAPARRTPPDGQRLWRPRRRADGAGTRKELAPHRRTAVAARGWDQAGVMRRLAETRGGSTRRMTFDHDRSSARVVAASCRRPLIRRQHSGNPCMSCTDIGMSPAPARRCGSRAVGRRERAVKAAVRWTPDHVGIVDDRLTSNYRVETGPAQRMPPRSAGRGRRRMTGRDPAASAVCVDPARVRVACGRTVPPAPRCCRRGVPAPHPLRRLRRKGRGQS